MCTQVTGKLLELYARHKDWRDSSIVWLAMELNQSFRAYKPKTPDNNSWRVRGYTRTTT